MIEKRKGKERRKSLDPKDIDVPRRRTVTFVDRRGKQRHTDDEVQILLVAASSLTMISMTENQFDNDELVALANELVRMIGFEPEAFFNSDQFRNILARHWGIPT